MAYMVMETNKAFAVVLNEEGGFLKVANINYSVGEELEDVVELIPPRAGHGSRTAALSVLAVAVCLVLVFFGAVKPNLLPYATVRIRINPDVLLTVGKTQRVLKLEGLNDDGDALLSDYDAHWKKQDAVTSELVERAADMGYLHDGGEVNITLDSADEAWESAAESGIIGELEKQLMELPITIYLSSPDEIEPHRVISSAMHGGQWESWEDYGEFSADMFEDWGEQTGDYFARWGIQTGEYFARRGEQIGETLGDGERWHGFARDSLSGILNSLRGLFE